MVQSAVRFLLQGRPDKILYLTYVHLHVNLLNKNNYSTANYTSLLMTNKL